MHFQFKKTGILQAIKDEKYFKFLAFLKFLFLILVFVAIGFVISALAKDFSFSAVRYSLGTGILLFCFFVLCWMGGFFYNTRIQKPKLRIPLLKALKNPDDCNFASFFDFETAKICWRAIRFCQKRASIASLKTVVLYFLIQEQEDIVRFVFKRGELSLAKLKEVLKKSLTEIKADVQPEVGFEKVILAAAEMAVEQSKTRIGAGDILAVLAQFEPILNRFLVESDFRPEDVKNLVCWLERQRQTRERRDCWWSYENLLKRGSIGKDWAAGYTVSLDRYCLDLRDKMRKNVFRQIVGHQPELKEVERILSKDQIKNVLLVGEPGSGRESIIEALAQKSFLGQSSEQVNFKRILIFDIAALLASISSLEQSEAVLEKCFQEAVEAKNVILVINNFHNFLSETSGPGTINLSGLLGRFMVLRDFQVIAVTTFYDFHSTIERNSSLNSLFEKVEVSEISEAETLTLMEDYIPFFEGKYKKFISYRALREILKLSSRYLTQNPFPEKALRLLDEAISYLVLHTKDFVLRSGHIRKVVAEKTSIPLESLGQKEKELLLNLEALIHQRLINQEEAVSEISAALRRARAQINLKSGPVGSFLFLGPTGVGKTETAKALAAIYFGSEQNMLRFDMSEFQNVEDVRRLIGSSKENGFLTTAVKEHPFSLVLLDEIEKAHPNILNLFLQVLDEGWLTDGVGRRVSFQNAIVIATSNAGAEVIRQSIQGGKSLHLIKDELVDFLLKEGMFRPEFINRFDAVIAFRPLSKENLMDIAGLMFKKLAKSLADKGIALEITKELKERIVELSFNPAFGAREMQRVIQDKVENVLAKSLLSGELKRGKKVRIETPSFNLVIN